MKGTMTNKVIKYFFNDKKWEEVKVTGEQPCPRVGHSTVVHGATLIVFGGRDEDNNKLNDMWELNISAGSWTEIKPSTDDPLPLPRSGHKTCVFENMMFLFGGIFEITKELNDVWAFNLNSKKWILIFDEPNSP